MLAAGGKLSDPEKFKRDEHPFDTYERLKAHAAKNEYPKPPDNFRWRYFGLFYVAPNQNSYMCRLRLPNGILKAAQFAGLADLAERYGGGYAHVTTRANIQIREIEAKNSVAMIEAIQDLGLCSRGSGADNIRNVTGTPTAGIDPQELIDTRPYAREWHFHILNDRSLYGLPRKFNVGFDGAGVIPVLEDTNDIGFQAVQVNDGFGLEPGVWFRLCLGGLTGHRSFAGDTGVIVRPADATIGRRRGGARVHRSRRPHRPHQGAAQIRARRRWALRNFSRSWRKSSAASSTAPRPARWRRGRRFRAPPISASMRRSRTACTGSASWCRSAISTVAQMRGLADIAREFGDGDIRLTVWQNLLISGVPTDKLEAARRRIEALGLAIEANAIRSGLVACTGNTGCKFAASDTKRHAEEIARWCETRVALDTPVNIHLTGCHHSCAQHFVAEIGLLACKVQDNEDADPVEGYHVLIGGGFGPDAALGRELYRDVKAEDAPQTIERILKAYLAHRASPRRKLHRLRAPPRDRRAQDDGRRGGRMSITPRPPIPSFLPETRLSRREQRAWLNGLFAGLFGLKEGVTPLSAQRSRSLCPADRWRPATAEIDDGAPWHDPAMPLADRMKLAEGKPLPRRMMAAMAQQDCGQCGYNCKDYSDALFAKKEERLNLCVPGGKETARMLKQLYQELERRPLRRPAENDRAGAAGEAPGRSRDNPVVATLVVSATGSTSPARRKRPGTSKSISRAPASIMRSATRFGIFPANDPGAGRCGDRCA